jgi:hypothetical protein
MSLTLTARVACRRASSMSWTTSSNWGIVAAVAVRLRAAEACLPLAVAGFLRGGLVIASHHARHPSIARS